MADYFEKNTGPKDIQLFRKLYLENYTALIHYACKFVDVSTAEDLVQNVFLKIWQKKHLFTEEKGLKTYIARAIQNACLDHLKSQKVKENYLLSAIRELQLEELQYEDLSGILSEQEEKLRSIRQQIDKLPEKCREIFLLSYEENKKTDEIAHQLHISTRTVEAQLYKALRLIRQSLCILLLIVIFL